MIGQSYIYTDVYDSEGMLSFMTISDSKEGERRMYMEDLSSKICKD